MAQFRTYPENVEYVHRAQFASFSVIDLMAFGLDTIVRGLSAETQSTIQRNALIEAAWSKDPHKRVAAALYSGVFDRNRGRHS